jgi:hypothetical protein
VRGQAAKEAARNSLLVALLGLVFTNLAKGFEGGFERDLKLRRVIF